MTSHTGASSGSTATAIRSSRWVMAIRCALVLLALPAVLLGAAAGAAVGAVFAPAWLVTLAVRRAARATAGRPRALTV